MVIRNRWLNPQPRLICRGPKSTDGPGRSFGPARIAPSGGNRGAHGLRAELRPHWEERIPILQIHPISKLSDSPEDVDAFLRGASLVTEAACPRCGGEVSIPAAGGEKVAVACQRCGSQLVFPVGRQSRRRPFIAEQETEEADEGAGGATIIPPGPGTVMVDLKKGPFATRRLETVVRGFLILVGAMPGEERLPLTGSKTVVGREGADIFIDDSALSRHHFEVEARADEFFIRDLDSSNGTFVNDTRIRACQLTSGDKIQAGRTTFTFSTLEVIPWDCPK